MEGSDVLFERSSSFLTRGQALRNCNLVLGPRVLTCFWKCLYLHCFQRPWPLQKDNPLMFSALYHLLWHLGLTDSVTLHRRKVVFTAMVCILYVGHTWAHQDL